MRLARTVALLLLAMSVASWVVILWKAWLLRRASADVARSTAAFWQSRHRWLTPHRLIRPLTAKRWCCRWLQATDVEADGHAGQRRRSRRSSSPACCAMPCTRCCGKLQFGQVLLATVGATAPFVGLLGTVWGIYHALIGIASAGQITIDKISGPVGESLIMTAAGLAVAIPAVLAYNVLGRAWGASRPTSKALRATCASCCARTSAAARCKADSWLRPSGPHPGRRSP